MINLENNLAFVVTQITKDLRESGYGISEQHITQAVNWIVKCSLLKLKTKDSSSLTITNGNKYAMRIVNTQSWNTYGLTIDLGNDDPGSSVKSYKYAFVGELTESKLDILIKHFGLRNGEEYYGTNAVVALISDKLPQVGFIVNFENKEFIDVYHEWEGDETDSDYDGLIEYLNEVNEALHVEQCKLDFSDVDNSFIMLTRQYPHFSWKGVVKLSNTRIEDSHLDNVVLEDCKVTNITLRDIALRQTSINGGAGKSNI